MEGFSIATYNDCFLLAVIFTSGVRWLSTQTADGNWSQNSETRVGCVSSISINKQMFILLASHFDKLKPLLTGYVQPMKTLALYWVQWVPIQAELSLLPETLLRGRHKMAAFHMLYGNSHEA